MKTTSSKLIIFKNIAIGIILGFLLPVFLFLGVFAPLFNDVSYYLLPAIIIFGYGIIISSKDWTYFATKLTFSFFTQLFWFPVSFSSGFGLFIFQIFYPDDTPNAGSGFGLMIYIPMIIISYFLSIVMAVVITTVRITKQEKKAENLDL